MDNHIVGDCSLGNMSYKYKTFWKQAHLFLWLQESVCGRSAAWWNDRRFTSHGKVVVQDRRLIL